MKQSDDQKLTEEEQALLDEATLKKGEPASQHHHPSMSPRLSRWPVTGGVCLLLIILGLIMWGLSSSAKNNSRYTQASTLTTPTTNTMPKPAEAPELDASRQGSGSIPPARSTIAETPLTPNPNTAQNEGSSPQQQDNAAQMRLQLEMQREQMLAQEQTLARQEARERAKNEAERRATILNADSTVYTTSNVPPNAHNPFSTQDDIQKQIQDTEEELRHLLAGGPSGSGVKTANNTLQGQISNSGVSSYLPHTRMPALSPYEVKAGAVIPSIMISGINSDLPGQIIAQVAQNVFDSATGRYLLIPQGARLVGNYDHGVVLGQQRVLISWNRIIYPDSSSVDIQTMAGQDQSGYAGFTDKVNNHTWPAIKQAVLLSAISAGAQLSQPRAQRGDYSYSAPQIATAAMGQQLNQLGMMSYQSRANLQPTITIRPGYRFNVMVNKDMILAPWQGKNAQNTHYRTALGD